MTRPKGGITGRAWKFGDNVDTDAIIPGKYLVLNSSPDLAEHAFETSALTLLTKLPKATLSSLERTLAVAPQESTRL